MAHYQGHYCNENIPGFERYLHDLDPEVDFERIESAIALNCYDAKRYTECRRRNHFRGPQRAHNVCMLNLRTRTPRRSQRRPSGRRPQYTPKTALPQYTPKTALPQFTPTTALPQYAPRMPLYDFSSAHDMRGMVDTPQQCSWRTDRQCEDDRCQLMDMGGWNDCVPRDCKERTQSTCWGSGADGSSCHWDEVEQECDAMYDPPESSCEGRSRSTCSGEDGDGYSCHWDEVEQECDAMYDALD